MSLDTPTSIDPDAFCDAARALVALSTVDAPASFEQETCEIAQTPRVRGGYDTARPEKGACRLGEVGQMPAIMVSGRTGGISFKRMRLRSWGGGVCRALRLEGKGLTSIRKVALRIRLGGVLNTFSYQF